MQQFTIRPRYFVRGPLTFNANTLIKTSISHLEVITPKQNQNEFAMPRLFLSEEIWSNLEKLFFRSLSITSVFTYDGRGNAVPHAGRLSLARPAQGVRMLEHRL